MKTGFSFVGKTYDKGVGANVMALVGDEARVAELGSFGYELLGMFVANLTGSSFAWLVEKIPGIKDSKFINSNLLTAVLGGVTIWKLPDILRLLGMREVAESLDTKDSMLGNMRRGAALLFGLSAGVQALDYVGTKFNVNIPGFSQKSMLSAFKAGVSGVGLLDIWSTNDYSTKLTDFEKVVEELNAKLKEIGMPSNRQQKELYLYAMKLLSYASININNTKTFMEKEDWSTVDNLMETIKEDTDISQGLIAGLAAAPAPSVEPVEAPAVAPASQTLPTTETIVNPENGAKIQATTPAMAEVPVVEKTSEGEPKSAGKAFYLDNILPWAQYVAKQTGWTPQQVATGFILKYLANNGHIWAYGPDQVIAYKNYAPFGTTAGVNANNPAYAIATVGGVRRTFKIRNVEGLRALAQSLLGR